LEQEGLWFLDQLTPGDVAYHIPAAFRLHGPLKSRCWKPASKPCSSDMSFCAPPLRLRNGQPIQVITPSLAFSLLCST